MVDAGVGYHINRVDLLKFGDMNRVVRKADLKLGYIIRLSVLSLAD